jgi:hypothetical protein
MVEVGKFLGPTSFDLFGEARKWWLSMDKDTRWNLT